MAKRTSTELTVNPEYMTKALSEMTIDQDEIGLFAMVPSQKDNGRMYTVRLDDSLLVPTVIECSCNAWEHYRRCRHALIVSSFFKRIYKSNLEKIEKKREALMDMPLNGTREFKLVG